MKGTFLCVVGARPNLMKIAPLISVLREPPYNAKAPLVHTGQHYDAAMNQQFFEALSIPHPDFNLEVGSSSHAVQTAEVMRRFEPVLEEERPSAVIVVGDVNSTLACALVASKRGVPVVHVEAGLRSFDRAMPEETNRVLTDQVSELLFTTERSARFNLLDEGVRSDRIHFVGNVMIDTLHRQRAHAVPVVETLARHGSIALDFDKDVPYALVTLHRPSNVDDADTLSRVLGALVDVSLSMPVVFPVHPRTRNRISAFGLDRLLRSGRFVVLPPVGYHEMLGLMDSATVVLSDSGGVQEETTALGVPCVTIRENTERPITVTDGTNTLAGTDAKIITALVADVLKTGGKAGRVPELWDGQASKRIAERLRVWLASNAAN